MINLEELEQLVAFDKLGKLSKVADKFMISSPSLSRNMQHIEEAFGVSLFDRSVNRISLNATGKEAVQAAKTILETTKKAIHDVQFFDQAQKTIYISSCAPMPLGKLLTKVSLLFPHKVVSHKIDHVDAILDEIRGKKISLAILPFPHEDFSSVSLFSETLYVSVRSDHELAFRKSVSFQDLNGYNFLLRSQLGFWDQLCHEQMPDSKFLVQDNPFEFDELVRTSSLPRFVTDKSPDFKDMTKDRINIPICDDTASVIFYLVCIDQQFKNIL